MFAKWEYIYTLYKEGSFTKAAEKLYISQPSLSVAVKNVEKKLGTQLFERLGSGVKLTESGKEYIAAVEKIISVERDLKNKINDINELRYGELTVGGSNYLSSYVLPRVITAFTSLHPQIKVTLVEGNSTRLAELLESGEVDIIVDSFDNEEQYEACPLAAEQILLCVPRGNQINKGLEKYCTTPACIYENRQDFNTMPSVPIDIFKDEKFILLKQGNDMYDRAMKLFEKNEITPRVEFLVDQLNISYALTESGSGLSFMTDTFFKYGKFKNDVLIYRVGEEYHRVLYTAYKKNRYCTKAMAEFIRMAKDIIK